ncbi:hypothetical protein COEREDRAFT_7306 [Coemansia reversa NRRL 1564]|uniref:Autophagy-related protein 29 n=1 Tax=Coemansia reversa (strain ATCC 12441 / NRRL 1564) TaxID=763665 RepID=A0A2G5BFD1_COERN|nr:hypothetical protein COEREDRAFT_7306 [Coemansia reversa NRRL 1564]|eukprot:PIA17714.1 hypothetical protein COEREDRAFT_7306 [Coemansia reversa NRRL 1564]
MDKQKNEAAVRVIFRFPFKRPKGFRAPEILSADEWTVEERVWRCLLSLPGPDRPQDILAELEQEQVTFDWELLAQTLEVSLGKVFEAASALFERHMGRPLVQIEESIQFTTDRQQAESKDTEESQLKSSLPIANVPVASLEDGDMSLTRESVLQNTTQLHYMQSEQEHSRSASVLSSHSLDNPANSRDFERTGLRSVESLGEGLDRNNEPGSPAVELDVATPRAGGSVQQLSVEDNGAATLDAIADEPIGVFEESGIPQTQRSVEPRLTRRLRDSHRSAFEKAPARTSIGDRPDMQQSMLADAIGSQFLPDRPRKQRFAVSQPVVRSSTNRPAEGAGNTDGTQKKPSSASSSFSDLSTSSLTESAMQDALISEAMNGSTAMSLLGSRMFPWSRKKR